MEGRKPEVEMFPIQFTVYKHTSYAPQAKQGFGWNTISNLFYSFIGKFLSTLMKICTHAHANTHVYLHVNACNQMHVCAC